MGGHAMACSMSGSETNTRSSVVCRRCGSARIRRSRARTRGEMLLRTLTPVHFHMCRDCGTRGWHLGASRVPLTESERRHAETHRINPAERSIKLRALTIAVVACVLGLALGLGLRRCDSKPAPPSTLEPLD